MISTTSENRTVASWTELGIYERIPVGVQSRHFCPECHPHRKPENQRKKDFVIADSGETGYCHHCHFSANLRTRGIPNPDLPPPPNGQFQPMPPTQTIQMPVSEPQDRRSAAKPPQMTPDPSDHAYDLWRPVLAQRGLDIDALIEDFNLVFTMRSDIGPTMVIPAYDPETGELVNHKYRSIDKQFRNDQGTYRPMYNLQRVIGADTIVIVEGELDVFAMDAAGFPHVISVPDGAPDPSSRDLTRHMAYLEEAMPILQDADRIIIATDNDAPGDFLRKEIESRIGVGSVAHIHFPPGIKDANDALHRLGKEWLTSRIGEARPAPASGVFTPESAMDDIEHILRYGFDTGQRIGYPLLDQIYRPTLGHLTILTGHAGSGKSTVLDNFVMKLTIGGGWPTTYFSPEQMPLARHYFNLAEIWYDKSSVKERALDYKLDQLTRNDMEGFIRLINPWISHINPELADGSPNLNTILDLATAECRRIGTKLLVLDPWNEIESQRPPHVTETEWVSIALGHIRRWARKHNAHVVLVAHPKKMRAEDGVDAIPGLSDISGSNNFRNKADYGLTVHGDRTQQLLPGQNSSVEVIVTKSRWRDSARVNGKAPFLYNPGSNRIETPPNNYAFQVQQPNQGSLY